MKKVVTGRDVTGRPTVLFEGEPANAIDFGIVMSTELWVTDSTPPELTMRDDTSLRPFDVQPPDRGLAFRIVTFLPDPDAISDEADPAERPEFLGAHVTDSLDFVVVISGELTLLFEGREITLKPGDAVVQQATPHDWVNRGSEPAVVAAVLVSTRV